MATHRPRNARTRILLDSVELGSIPHIRQLSNEGWPKDLHDQRIAIDTVLRILSERPTPSKPEFSSDRTVFLERTQPLQRVNALLEVVALAARLLPSESREAIEVFSRIFEGNISNILRWLNFYVKSSRWIFCYDADGHTDDMFAAGRAGEIFTNIWNGCGVQLRTSLLGSQEAVDFVLALWMWVDKTGSPLYFPYRDADHELCPITKLLSVLFGNPNAKPLLNNTISSFTRRQHTHLLNCALSRIAQWKAARLRPQSRAIPNDAITIIFVLRGLIWVPGFRRAFVKLNIAGQAMKLALEHPEWQAHGPPGILSIKMASILFFGDEPWANPAYYQHHVVPQLLEAGVLVAIVEDYLSRRSPHTPYPFFSWTNSAATPGKDPLSYLGVMCLDPRILKMTDEALGSLPRGTLARLEEGLDHGHNFKYTIELYKRIWSRLPLDKVSICDNLNHHLSLRSGQVNAGKECSGCGAKVYCSPECQEEDWAIHRSECGFDHHRRKECELGYAWVSHRTRAFLLALLHYLLLRWECCIELEDTLGQLSSDSSVLSHTHSRDNEATRSGGLTRSTRYAQDAIHFIVKAFPFQWATHSLDHLRGMQCRPTREQKEARPIYEGERFSFLFDEFAAGTMADETSRSQEWNAKPRLASFAMSSGRSFIYVLGRFTTTRTPERTDVKLLNGYIAVDWDRD